jgi:RNase P/RNase MRP subunit p29
MNEEMEDREILIGCRIKVSESENRELEGTAGEVIDETKNLIVIKTKKGIKKLIKKQIKTEKIR